MEWFEEEDASERGLLDIHAGAFETAAMNYFCPEPVSYTHLYRDRIYEEVWEGEFDPDSRTVDIHVQRLKKKAGLEDSIVSVRGVGYRLEAPET